MKKIVVSFVVVMIVAFGLSASAEVKVGDMTLNELREAMGMSIYLQAGYTFNFSNPENRLNDFRAFDQQANSFTIDLAQLVFSREAKKGTIGYGLKISAGETAQYIHAGGLDGGTDPETPDTFDLTEAYMTYLAPLGSGLEFKFGKMPTFIGAEVIEAIDNPNYSRSFNFFHAIPFTHTGLMIGYDFSDAFTADIYIVNGWDNAVDNNKDKSLGASIGVNSGEWLTMLFNFLGGPEQDDNNTDVRYIFDWVGTISLSKKSDLILNYDYGTEENAPSITPVRTARWSGIAAILTYAASDRVRFAIRGEYVDDPQGYRLGTDQDTNLKEVTLTTDFILADGLVVRPEYRRDWSNQTVFDNDTKRSQDTIALGVMYRW